MFCSAERDPSFWRVASLLPIDQQIEIEEMITSPNMIGWTTLL